MGAQPRRQTWFHCHSRGRPVTSSLSRGVSWIRTNATHSDLHPANPLGRPPRKTSETSARQAKPSKITVGRNSARRTNVTPFSSRGEKHERRDCSYLPRTQNRFYGRILHESCPFGNPEIAERVTIQSSGSMRRSPADGRTITRSLSIPRA